MTVELPVPKKPVVLLVEDNDLKARALQRLLIASGLDVFRETTLHGALKKFQELKTVDFIVTDWNFPMRDGDTNPRNGLGASVVSLALHNGVPYAVFSSDEAPPDFKSLNRWFVAGAVNSSDLRDYVCQTLGVEP